jgi:hypothetical protein
MNRTTTAPTWTTSYDSTGQAPSLVPTSATGELGVRMLADRLDLDLRGDDGSPMAGSFGLSGTLTCTVPEDLPLAGLLLVIDGFVARTPGTQVAVTGAIGGTTTSRGWPLRSIAGATSPAPPASRGNDVGGTLAEEDFRIECFAPDFNPTSVGVAPFGPFPPVPITLGVQARVRASDESLHVGISAFELIILTTR